MQIMDKIYESLRRWADRNYINDNVKMILLTGQCETLFSHSTNWKRDGCSST